MLVLPIRNLADLVALDDDAAPDRVYVALARPRVARRADGSPRFQLVRWVAQSETTDAREAGARLTLDVETAPDAREIQAADLGSRQVFLFPWLDAIVRLDGPQFDPVEAEVSLAMGRAGAVAVDLSPLAAGILAPLLQAESVSPLQVTWTGHVLVRLPPVEVIATADVQEVRRRIEIVEGGHQVTMTRSIIDANARIEIRGADNVALEQALREWVLDELVSSFAQGGNLTVRAAASDVVRWPIQLATTLDDFISASSRGTLVKTVILGSKEMGHIPPIEVRVLGNFAGPLERVDVRLQGALRSDVIELPVSDDAPRSVALGTLEFRWSYRVKIENHPSGDWSPWQDAHGSTSLVVPVSIPSGLSIEVVAVGLDFHTRWVSVRVVLEHKLPGSPPTSHTVELDALHRSHTWTRSLEGIRGTLKARVSYVSRQGQSVERIIDEIINDQVVVRDPLDNYRVRLALVPVGTGWGEVAIAMVDLRYVDGAHVINETVELRKLDDFLEWEAPARPDGPHTIQWRVHISFADGRFESRDWQTTSSEVTVVRIDGAPRRTVQLLPIYFDPSVTQKGIVRLRSGMQTESVVITDRAQRSVMLGPGPFLWSIAWTAADGTAFSESAPEEGEDVIVVPRFRRD